MKPDRLYVLFIIVVVLALSLRLAYLSIRPMHTDEAVHAVKFGALLEKGYYRYDRNEFHGPSLNYLTLIPAWLLNQKKLEEINEFTLRSVPAFGGVGLILLLLLIKRYIDRSTMILSAFLISISPAMVFYGRYYIQEILLVFFTYGFIFTMIRLWDSKKIIWALFAGTCLGMMFATKETWIISFGAMFLTAVIIRLTNNNFRIESFLQGKISVRNMLVVISTAVIISVLFYSSFFKNPQGVVDSITAFSNYFGKAGHFDKHIHPWFFYIEVLGFKRGPDFIWSEIFLLAGGFIGLWYLFKKKAERSNQIIMFIGIYSLILGIIYSLLPYKTPWNVLGFYFGWLILASYGFSEVLKIRLAKPKKIALNIFLMVGMIHLLYQTYLSNFKYFADPYNPYVYAHTSNNIFSLINQVEKITEVQHEGKNITMEIICVEHDYWPLPWYFRGYPNVGWWDEVNMDIPAAPIIIASPAFEESILRKLYEIPPPGYRYLYMPIFQEPIDLRPNAYLDGYVRKDVWDDYVQKSLQDESDN